MKWKRFRSAILQKKKNERKLWKSGFKITYRDVLPGTPGAPKYFTAVRAFFRPRRSTVFFPVGLRRASWSKVRHFPPAFVMRARAVVVKRNAQTSILGTSRRRGSSSTVPTITAILSFLFFMYLTKVEVEIGGRFTRLIHNRFKIVSLKALPVLRAKKRYNFLSTPKKK